MTTENSLVVKCTNIVPGNIVFDSEPIKTIVSNFLTKYDGLVITEDDIKDAKSELAFLRKQKKTINDSRIKVSKEFMVPVDTYKAECDSIIELIDSTVESINNQVNYFEEKRKEEKKNEVLALMKELKELHHLDDDFEFEMNSKFLNKSTTMATIKDMLIEQMEKYKYKVMVENEIKRKKQFIIDTINELNSKNNVELKYADYEYLAEYNELASEGEKFVHDGEIVKILTTVIKSMEQTAPVNIKQQEEVIVEPQIKETKNDSIKNIKATIQITESKENLKKICKFMNDNKIDHILLNIESLECNSKNEFAKIDIKS